MLEVNMYVSDDREAQIRAAEAAAAKALAMNPNATDVHVTYGTVLFAMRAPERALREFELAVSLDGNLALAHGYLGLMKFFLGRAREIRSHISEAMRLSPRDPPLFHWHFFIGVADLYLGRMGSALESLRKSVEINPNWGSPNSSWLVPWRSRSYPQKPPRFAPPPVAFRSTSPSPSSAPKQ
jgi:tetratricopeptide (TPR) repeat protein